MHSRFLGCASSRVSWLTCLVLVLALDVGACRTHGQEAPAALPDHWWSAQTEQALEQASTNRPQWTHALDTVPPPQRDSLAFLLENMPARDLQGLSSKYLLENIALATEAFEQAPWAHDVPREIFLNDVLPYVSSSEQRDDWRADLHARCTPLVAGCRTPAQAALRLNERLFPLVNVRYSTARAKADQSPAETMSSGLASCTGLSILLVDACRAVGVPARVAGIPNWVDGRGNHTWVEVWDAGRWHFIGAAEPDQRGLDHAWFERDATLAQKDVPGHAIYAVSFRKTGTLFPVAWKPGDPGDISAENVTERYADAPSSAGSLSHVMLRVHERPDGPRVAASVRVAQAGATANPREGTSKDESHDTNDMLGFDLPQGQSFEITAEYRGQLLRRNYMVGDKAQDTLDLAFEAVPVAPPPVAPTAAAVPPLPPFPVDGKSLADALAGFFAAPEQQQANWKFDPEWDRSLQSSTGVVRQQAWEAFRASPIHADLRADHTAKRVRFQSYTSPYTIRTIGTKPAGGWGLVIAMHGGGGAPKEVNDSQWAGMLTYYHDHPEAGGYLYLALRAPNDTWNGFYDDYVYPLVANLLRQFAVCEDMDLNRVYLIGYSHGGYGAFAIGPKMPDRFAAIHSSAAAPTDGETSAKTLRNTPFTFWVGEHDEGYGRRERCRAFEQLLAGLRGSRRDIYPASYQLKQGYQHGNLPDHEELGEMVPLTRNPVPRELTWEQTDGVIQDFYWLRDAHPGKKCELDVSCRDNLVRVEDSSHDGPFSVFLDERLVDFEKPVAVDFKGKRTFYSAQPSLLVLCQGIAERADPDLAFTVRMDLP